LTGHRLAEHPDFVTVATRAGLPTLVAISGWPPLALAEDGGPLFAEATRREVTAVPETSLAWDAAGEASKEAGGTPLITRQEEVAPLVLAAAGYPADRG